MGHSGSLLVQWWRKMSPCNTYRHQTLKPPPNRRSVERLAPKIACPACAPPGDHLVVTSRRDARTRPRRAGPIQWRWPNLPPAGRLVAFTSTRSDRELPVPRSSHSSPSKGFASSTHAGGGRPLPPPLTTYLPRSPPARRSGWWASPGRASRPSVERSWGWLR